MTTCSTRRARAPYSGTSPQGARWRGYPWWTYGLKGPYGVRSFVGRISHSITRNTSLVDAPQGDTGRSNGTRVVSAAGKSTRRCRNSRWCPDCPRYDGGEGSSGDARHGYRVLGGWASASENGGEGDPGRTAPYSCSYRDGGGSFSTLRASSWRSSRGVTS